MPIERRAIVGAPGRAAPPIVDSVVRQYRARMGSKTTDIEDHTLALNIEERGGKTRSRVRRERSSLEVADARPLGFEDLEAPAVQTAEPEHLPTAVAVTVVIPTRNEAENIAWVLRRMPMFVDEVVIVDGRSTDGTVDVARMIRPDVVVVSDRGLGKGDAMRVGAAVARGSIVVMIDADGSMHPAEIERFVEPLTREYDFVKGSRFVEGGGTTDMTLLRRAGHVVLLAIANTLTGSRWTDLCYGFCAFRRSALEELALDADGFEIETQMVVRASRMGLRMKEVPSFEFPRRFGVSKLNTFRDGWRVLRTIMSERLRPIPRGLDETGMVDELTDA
jgi:cellulose synthase/poly-beta-1,6-N-acetylglucosamine synthase-like glycosyltransferase